MTFVRSSIFLLLLLCVDVPSRADDTRSYLNDVKPVLQERCYACHGALKQKAGLRLDTAEHIRKGSRGGIIVTPRQSNASDLIDRVTTSDLDERMPPEGEPLKASEIEAFRKWIDAGAPIPKDEVAEVDPQSHWSFQRIVRPKVPKGQFANPIDAFLAAKQTPHGLTSQPEAERIVLLRRLYLDLIGIPPTAAEIAAFENNKSADWYEHTVKRLLDDPRHGERWARHWMDIWRYSDWWGLGQQLRNSQKHIWHWRDWIVESLNANTPYDEMIRQMLAADELYPNDLSKLRATGYLARNYFLFNRTQWMEETVEHVGKGFLGLTFNCAKCHDHKYDPIAQADFYRMRAFFEPYHVRMEVVPGQRDLTQDGIPRVFDGQPDTPTYLFRRGDEKHPDKSKVIQPGIPKLLAFDAMKINTIKLPADAWQPERRPWVADAHITFARKQVEHANAALQKANQALVVARTTAEEIARKNAATKKQSETNAKPDTVPSIAKTSKPIVTENFKTLDKKRWQLFAGKWKHQPGELEQTQDGPTRAALRLKAKTPRDFDATVRFTILGGSKWRSVGLSFDAADGDPTSDKSANYSEQQVYASAYAGGPKIHASYNTGGKWHYPPTPSVRMLPIQLKRAYTMRVRVRDQLINVSLDGQPVIACKTSLKRRDGWMQLTTFDALAIFHEVTINELAADTKLREPNNTPIDSPAGESELVTAQFNQQRAEAKRTAAQAELASIEKRVEAMGADDQTRPTKIKEAVIAERRAAVANAKHGLVLAQQKLSRAANNKKAEADKSLKAAKAALAKAEMAAQSDVKPTDKFTRLVGAKWSATRFINSGRDDPAINFPAESTGRRLALANWMTDRRNPLTARVAVNHIWSRHMGQPLVPTMFDFGRNGLPPTHPKLLDWLAAELMENDWDMKHLHHVIVSSAAYRMKSSTARDGKTVIMDPENRHFARRLPIRLESQVVRDSILALAGTLDATMGGPSVPPSKQASSTRRSLYFFHSNNDRNLFLTMFDDAAVKECYRREQSIVPQQALALTNSQLVLDASKNIAKRLSNSATDDVDFIRTAFAVMLGIKPSEAEIAACRESLNAWRKLPKESTNARAHLVWVLINHNDFVTLR